MDSPSRRKAGAHPTQSNIEATAKMEHDSLERRTLTERVSGTITKLAGNPGFLLAQHIIPGVKAFDPFPFGVLASIVSSEGVFLTIFVLVRQTRMARQSERRSHLDLQVSTRG